MSVSEMRSNSDAPVVAATECIQQEGKSLNGGQESLLSEEGFMKASATLRLPAAAEAWRSAAAR